MGVLYILLLAGAAIFNLLYKDTLSFLTLVMLIIFPVILFVLLLVISSGISAEFEDKHIVTDKNKPLSINVRIVNKSILPAANIKIYIRYSNRYNGKIYKSTVNIPAAAKSSEVVSFNVNYAHCGVLDILIKKIVIFDFIKLFRISKHISKTASVIFLPEAVPLAAEITSCADTDMDSDTFYSDRAGDDPTEVFDLREYQDSDNLNRIHWKLSSRNEEMIVREFSKPYTSTILILPEVADCKSESEADAVLEIMNSLAVFLAEQGVEFNIGRVLPNDGSVVLDKIKSNEDLLYFCCSVIEDMRHSNTSKLIENIVCSENELKIYSHIVYISPDCNIDSLADVRNATCAKLTYIQPVSDKKTADNIFLEADEYIPVRISNISEGLLNINL